jgi:hypothetical protein
MSILYIIGAILFILLVFFLLKKLIKAVIILLLIGALIFLYYRYKGSGTRQAIQPMPAQQQLAEKKGKDNAIFFCQKFAVSTRTS